jgi:nitroreductase
LSSERLCTTRSQPCKFEKLVELTPDELLTTTRAVKHRLDLTRPVGRELIEECVSIALQAPNAGNRQKLHFVVVTDAEKRASLADIYRKGSETYFEMRKASLAKGTGNPTIDRTEKRVYDSAVYLRDHLHEIPVHVIPCVEGRTEGKDVPTQAARWGSIYPAAWSFMLAGRARGLGMTFTSLHLNCEKEAATLLGIPYAEVMQAGLLPVAFYQGTEFKKAQRPPTIQLVHWDSW